MALVIYMPDVPFSSAHHSPLKEPYSSAQSGDDTRQPFWDCLPPDTLALVASHLKTSYIAAARQTCKAWRHGISRGVTTLKPNVQSPAGNRVGSVASYYLYGALRWQDMPQLLAVFDSCRTLDLRNATVSLGCADLLRGAPSLECLRLRSDLFTADKGAPSKHEEMRKFIALLPATIQRIELDLRWDSREFLAAVDPSTHRLKALPSTVEVDSLYIAAAQFMPHHMDSIAAFQGLKVLHMDRATLVGAMDSAAFSVLGELTELEELVLAPQLTGVDDEGFMLGFGPLHRLRRLELCGVERMSDAVIEALWAQWARLGSLRLSSCRSLTDRALHRMAVLPSLYTLFLCGNQNFSHGLMSAVKQRVKLATFRQCGDLSVCIYSSLPRGP